MTKNARNKSRCAEVSSNMGLQHVREGFLGTAAPLYADIVLLAELAMGAALLFGFWLARKRKFKAHAICQSTVVLLNGIVIVCLMLPVFFSRVMPKVPAKLGKSHYLISTAHAALGTISEVSGLYIAVAAGTNLLPARLRFNNYKLWMRTTLALWWVTLLLGVATYLRWYVR